jgi:dihydroceramidase
MSSSLFDIKTRVHSETGFWGPVDANHQFCEPHYDNTFFLAEFYNALSSLIYVGIGIYIFRRIQDPWIRASSSWLCLIGVGSFLFHGTMRRSMQLLDEIPMVGMLCTGCLGKVEQHPWLHGNASQWRRFLFVLFVAVALTYVWFDRYELFIHGFTALVLVDGVIAYTMPLTTVNQVQTGNFLLYASFLSIVVGKILWEVEGRFCQSMPQVWPLHVVWHFFSGMSAYYGVLFNSLVRDGNLDLSWAFLVPAPNSLKAKKTA